jgi:hypothetical protein
MEVDVARMLIERGADATAQNDEGETCDPVGLPSARGTISAPLSSCAAVVRSGSGLASRDLPFLTRTLTHKIS